MGLAELADATGDARLAVEAYERLVCVPQACPPATLKLRPGSDDPSWECNSPMVYELRQ